ncbi:LCP family protein [Streptomyces sp. RKAG290]|uniref:LCP family protein n=1 Tax=Streptomyces sp. RKAG290 TaxID=2888348 RepID=UPI00203445B5|nr:LCP family protein [Streptomyces sp. RKAG290]MCM2413730.1 LCP family protein [Streptomyces sp. RKAG290]
MGRSSTPGEGTRPRVRHAGQHGWDDGLYQDGKSDAAAPGGDAEAGDADSGRRGAGHGAGHGGRRGRPHRAGKRKKRRVLRWIAFSVAFLILATGSAGYLWYQHLNGNLRKGERSAGNSAAKKTAPNAAGQTPLNLLLIGSDSRNSKENLRLGGSKESVGGTPLADVQMLLHVSADRKNASVVSIPRDTRVDIPACENPETHKKYPASNGIINETLRGGPGCTLDTWEKLTGVYIDHWMMVDFAGVVDMADAVGGAWVCVKQNVNDVSKPGVPGGSHLRLTAGRHKIKGEDALKWLRTRHAFESDIGRSKAQHMYLNSVMRELKNQNAFTDTGRLMNLAETGTKSLQVSEEIGTVKKLFDLGMQLKNVPLDKMNMLTMPRIEDPEDPDAHVLPKPGAADKLWALLRDDQSLDPKDRAKAAKKAAAGPKAGAPASLGVTVVNGTSADGQAPAQGRAGTVRDLLKAKGFTEADTSADPGSALTTEVAYPRSAGAQGKSDALSVAKALSLPTSAVKETPDGAGLTLTVGSDWRTGATFPKAVADDSDPLEGTESVNGGKTDDCMDVYWPYRQM